MDKKYLIKTAKHINQVNANTFKEYNSKLDTLIQLMNEKMLSRSDISELVGEKNIDMMKDNHANHARFIASLLKEYTPEVFVDTVLWVFRAYQSRDFHSNYWAAQLNSWIEVLKKELSEKSFNEILPYYEWMQVNIPIFVKLSLLDLDKGKSVH